MIPVDKTLPKGPQTAHDDEERPISSSTGTKSYHETGRPEPYTIRLGKLNDDEPVPRQPNDRDESPQAAQEGPREVIAQAYKDVTQGQVDTDLREQRGVEKTVDAPFRPATEMPEKKLDRS
jgi:hypothetical protein